MDESEKLAKQFHETYERLAPTIGDAVQRWIEHALPATPSDSTALAEREALEQLIIDMRAIGKMLGEHQLASVCEDYARRAEAAPVQWKCKASAANTDANDPQDCDWPACGCDPDISDPAALRPRGNCPVCEHPLEGPHYRWDCKEKHKSATFMAKLLAEERLVGVMEEHKSHIEFESELYATLVDPVAEGSIKEADMRKQLLESARWYRQHVYDLETQLAARVAELKGEQKP